MLFFIRVEIYISLSKQNGQKISYFVDEHRYKTNQEKLKSNSILGVYYVCVYSIFYIIILTRKNSTRLLLEKIGKESREYDGKWIHKSLYRSSDGKLTGKTNLVYTFIEISGKLTVVSKPNTDDSGIWDNIEFGCEEEQYDKNTPDIDPDDSEAVIFLVQAGACNYEDKIDVAKKFLKKGKLAKNPAGIIIFDGQSDKIIDKSLNDNAKNKTKGSGFFYDFTQTAN